MKNSDDETEPENDNIDPSNLLIEEINRIKSLNQLRKDYAKRSFKLHKVKPAGQLRFEDSTFRSERRITPRRMRELGTGLGTKSKIIRHASAAASDEELQRNVFAITERGVELTPSAVTSYKWRTVEFIKDINLNVVGMFEITDALLNMSTEASIVDYLMFLVEFAQETARNVNVFDKSMKNLKQSINKIITYHFNDKQRKDEVYDPAGSLPPGARPKNFEEKYETLYENLIAYYARSFRTMSSKHNMVNLSEDVIDESCVRLMNKLIRSFKRKRSMFSDKMKTYVTYTENEMSKMIFGAVDAVFKMYRPMINLQVFQISDANIKRYKKIRKNELVSIDSDDDEIASDENHVIFGAPFDMWKVSLDAFNRDFAESEGAMDKQTRENYNRVWRRRLDGANRKRAVGNSRGAAAVVPPASVAGSSKAKSIGSFVLTSDEDDTRGSSSQSAAYTQDNRRRSVSKHPTAHNNRTRSRSRSRSTHKSTLDELLNDDSELDAIPNTF